MKKTVQRTGPQGSSRTPATCIAATTPGLIVRILNFVLLRDNDLLRLKHVGVLLSIFMYFNIEINILD